MMTYKTPFSLWLVSTSSKVIFGQLRIFALRTMCTSQLCPRQWQRCLRSETLRLFHGITTGPVT
jgi:hypothetical protein